MILFAKLLVIALYVAGLASFLGMLPPAWHIVAIIAAAILAIHVLEVFIMFKHVRRYEGSLAMSIVLAVLFGVLHWKPLANKAKAGAV